MRLYGNQLTTTPYKFAIYILGFEFAVTQLLCVRKINIGICPYYRESHIAWASRSEKVIRMKNYFCLLNCLINFILKYSPSAFTHNGLHGVHIKYVL